MLGGGPVLKLNANQSYATDARSGGWFAARCADAGVPLQHFVTRADLPVRLDHRAADRDAAGPRRRSTSARRCSAMHSCRELASAADVPLMVQAMTACFENG